MTAPSRLVRPALVLALFAAGAGVSGCALIDENAELDQRVMETMEVDTARESNYPRGSADPNSAY